MTLSNSKNFELNVTDYIEEAYERCGLELRTGYDLETAKRSMNLLLADWANRGLNQWTIQQTITTVTEGVNYISPGSDTIDVLDAVLRRNQNGTDTDMSLGMVSRAEFLNIPDKSNKARPTQYFVDKQIDPKIYLWPTPDNSTDKIVYNRLVRMDDADAATNTLQMPFRFYPCLASGLAYMLSVKKAPERTELLKAAYEDDMRRAIDQDEPRSSFRVAPDMRSFMIR
tara:strand:- start:8157 stop:8837 length:681 start_codon:yes stop_codon:yes gene_type:complete